MENIILNRGQILSNEPNYRVHTSATYTENDLVEVHSVDNDSVPVCRYTAFYVKYGYEKNSSSDGGIFKINMSTENPQMLNYDIFGLHKRRTIIKGELTKVEYYSNYDGTVYSDLILEENITYNRNGVGLVMNRQMNICWYLTDNAIGYEKKYYKVLFHDRIYRRGFSQTQ